MWGFRKRTYSSVSKRVCVYLLLEDVGQWRTICRVNELDDFVYAPLQRISIQHQLTFLLHLTHTETKDCDSVLQNHLPHTSFGSFSLVFKCAPAVLIHSIADKQKHFVFPKCVFTKHQLKDKIKQFLGFCWINYLVLVVGTGKPQWNASGFPFPL